MTGQLYSRYSEKVCHYLAKRLGEKAVACDLMQDTFQKVIRNQDKIDKIKNCEAWIFRIAHNTLIDYTRKKKEHPLNDSQILRKDSVKKDSSNIEEISECLYELIEENIDDTQDILVDVFTKSISQKEAAEYLDIPYSTFKSRVQKVRKTIVSEFEKRCCHLKYNKEGQIIGCGPS